ncbi:LuxR C-terminal-related transcriptional regulator [Yersinia frederiksenii]|uniref:LuxR C-terminal-related transcriptional regulator n=1 Tax=Yersinia frederiksenii TaxID=29484 RepID=UPI0011A9AEC1|nr:LuxR C-terminal-related transcriptional regulator [Yersinia frederiksenii]
MNILILSKCKLTSFSFECIFNEKFNNSTSINKATIKSHSTINALVKEVSDETKLILIDMTLTSHVGLHAFLKELEKHIRVIILCESNTDSLIFPGMFNAVLYKGSSISNITKTISRVCNINHATHDRDISAMPQLTTREREALKLIMSGLNNKQIAKELSINYKTVSYYRRNICRKYSVNSLNAHYLKSRI